MKTIFHKTMWLLFIAVALIMTSCSKGKDHCDPNDEESPCYVEPVSGDKLLVVETKTNGLTSSFHEYDDQNRAIIIYAYNPENTLELTTTYTYSGNTDFPATVRAENKDGHIGIQEYTYGNDGQVASMVMTVSSDPDAVLIDYQYTYFQNRLVETIIPREDDPSIYVNTYIYDDKGNLLSIEYTVDGQWGTTVEQGDYDDKNAPYKYGNPLAWMFPGVNNHRMIKATAASLGTTSDQVYKHIYNHAGYPTKTEVYNRGSDVVAETIEYIYKKAN